MSEPDRGVCWWMCTTLSFLVFQFSGVCVVIFLWCVSQPEVCGVIHCVCVLGFTFYVYGHSFPAPPSASELYSLASILCTVAESACVCRTVSLTPPPTHTRVWGGSTYISCS